jgi:hypothetical protein
LAFGIAEYHLRVGDRRQCREILQDLTREGDPQWQRRAMFELAELACQMGQAEICDQCCAALLQMKLDDTQRKTVLRIAGRLLEQQGNYHGAALCFAGVSPYSQQPLRDDREARQP